MNCVEKVFGAKALIYLKTNQDIQKISIALSKGLILPEIEIAPAEYPPYDLSGSCEALGFELWLEKTDKIDGLHYSLKIETEYSIIESFEDQMHDLSQWLARYISKICNIDTFIPCIDNRSGLLYTKGQAKNINILELKLTPT